MDRQQIEKELKLKNDELATLQADVLSETQKKQKEQLEKNIEELKKQLDELEKLETTTTTDKTKKETEALKDNIEVDTDRTYELMKESKMHDKLLAVLGSESKVENFALEIDKVVRKYLDQEMEGFSNSIKNSMCVGIQFAMMECLTKQGAEGATEFFDAFSKIKSKSTTKAFEGLYKSFGKLGSANEFFVLANKVQNITRYLSDKKSIITASKSIPELMNPVKFKKLLNNPAWSNQAQIDKLDITKILTLDATTSVELSDADKAELKKIVDNANMPITEKTIASIQKSLKSADKLLDTRGKFKTKASELVDKIAGLLDIDIPFLGNLGEMMGMEFPTDILGERKDGGVMNFVLGALGFRGGLKGLHREYIKEKLDEIDIDNVFVATAYAAYQKNIDVTITNDSETSTWKICALAAPDAKTETAVKAKIPADYAGLKKSIIDNLDTAALNPTMVAKFAPDMITEETDKSAVDVSKINDKDAFVDQYLMYIIPLLADPTDDFISSKKIDKDSFALAVMGGLVGDKYFIEGVNIGLLSTTDFKPKTETPIPETKETVDYDNYAIRKLNTSGLTNCNMSENDYQNFAKKVIDIAKELEMNPEHLMKVMAFETVGTFDSKIQNPKSGATGLIQFLDSTATDLGTNINSLKNMTALEQLDIVKAYFEKQIAAYGKLTTLEDVYLAVFSPAFIGKGLDYVGYSAPDPRYTKNVGFDMNKDGKMTVEEITDTVRDTTKNLAFFENVTQKSGTETSSNIKIEAKKMDQIVLFGDSHAGGIRTMGGFTGKTLYHNGYDSGRLLDALKKEKTAIKNYKSLVLITGTNDISKGLTNKLKDNLTAIKNEIAPIQLVLSTLPYSNVKTIASDAEVDEVNTIIREFAKDNTLPVIDLHKEITLKDSEYRANGHYTNSGYTKLAQNITTHITGDDNLV